MWFVHFPGKKIGCQILFPKDHPFGRPIPWVIWSDSWHALGFFFRKENRKRNTFTLVVCKVENGGGDFLLEKLLGKILKLEGYLLSVFWRIPTVKFAGVVVGGLFLEFFFVLGRGEATKNWVFFGNFWSWVIRDDFGWRKIHHFCRRLQDERDQIEQQKLIEHFR